MRPRRPLPLAPHVVAAVVRSLTVAVLAFFLPIKPLPSSLTRPGLLAHLFSSAPAISHPPAAAIAPTIAAIMASPTSALPYARELQVAQLAVQRAARLTRRVFETDAKGTLSKDDKSPVTVGDFGAQALIIAALRANFPSDAIVAEEEAASLRGSDDDDGAVLRRRIWGLVRETRLDDYHAEQVVLGGAVASEAQMLDLIDGGASPGGLTGRVWAIDPIDGTKGFLRGGQYAVCLALIEDGRVVVGVLGCPNLPVDDAASLTPDLGLAAQQQKIGDEGIELGVLFAAAAGQGATSRPMGTGGLAGPARRIAMRLFADGDTAGACFCESYESGHSDHGRAAVIAARLGITRPSVRMDSQAKYGSIARGAGDIYLRLPTSATYVEKIWDHAAGDLIVRESGGEVTDVEGKKLDFSVGRTLARNRGVVASPKAIIGSVLKAVREVLGAE